MSANLIQAKYEILETIAQRFQSRAEEMAQVTTEVQRGMEALQKGGWEGEGSAAFFAASTEVVLPTMRRLSAALEGAGKITLEIRTIMQEAEEEAAKPFMQNGEDRQAEEEHGVLDHIGDFFVGMYEEVEDSVVGLFNVVVHPLDTWEGIKYAVKNPMVVLDAMLEPYEEAIESGHPAKAAGRGLIFALSFIGPGLLLKGGKALKAADLAADAARAADAAADAARLADLTADAGRVASATHRVSATQRLLNVSLLEKSFPDLVDAATAFRNAPIGSPLRDDLADLLAIRSRVVVDEPNRLVLGKWEKVGGYIEEAKKGGIRYETPDGVYDAFGRSSDEIWPINERFLRHHLEAGVPRIEFHAWPKQNMVDEILKAKNAGTLDGVPPRVKEFLYLEKHAAEYGYVREGMNFVKRDPNVPQVDPRFQRVDDIKMGIMGERE